MFDFTILTVWENPAETDTHLTWARDLFGAIQPHATGVYVNNLGVEGAERGVERWSNGSGPLPARPNPIGDR